MLVKVERVQHGFFRVGHLDPVLQGFVSKEQVLGNPCVGQAYVAGIFRCPCRSDAGDESRAFGAD